MARTEIGRVVYSILLGHLGTILIAGLADGAEPAVRSHPPLRSAPGPIARPPVSGPVYHADPQRGDDRSPGTAASPWRTIGHGMRQLRAGDTLELKGGVYNENVYLALAGRPDAPITLRSAPGEQAILDGGLPEFFRTPADSWEPHSQGSEGEFRSKKSYPNLRDVVGSFGDSMIGLQTYYHAKDLRSTSERIDWEDWNRTAETDIKPLYCGPGLWYDRATGRIHARLAHTHLPEPIPNYSGPTDPRQLPLLIAPFRSTPLHIDGARHVRFQDLVIRGAGYTAILLDNGHDIEFDNVTVWCGTYGIRAAGTTQFRFLRSALHGNVAPWTFRSDGSKRDYPGRPHRNISRLNTHALLEIDGGRESSVYATPQNDRWEIAWSDFTDAHDALYLGAINVRFHHNWVDNLQDDGLYLSPMYHRHRLDKIDPEIHVEENLFTRMLTAIAFGGTETETRDRVFIARNVFDLRGQIHTGRPSVKSPAPGLSAGKLMGDHGSPPWPAMNIYHNTFIMADSSRDASMATLGASRPGRPRRVFNNLFVHLDRLAGFIGPEAIGDAVGDGNLYWAPGVEDKLAASFFQRYRASEAFAQNRKLYPPGSTTHSLVADPRFVKLERDPRTAKDYRLQLKSPAIDAGVDVPADWKDPLRSQDRGKPDIGALPAGAPAFAVGRAAFKPSAIDR